LAIAVFEVTISDNGSGFDPTMQSAREQAEASLEILATPAGDGLRNMKQRLADIGGQCSINSRPGTGTIIQFVLPLAKLKKEESQP
jgi:signal transduction histidine kinase